MRNWLPIAHLVLTTLLVGWNVVLASRIAQMRKAPRPFAAITALAGFLLIPAILLTIAEDSTRAAASLPRSRRVYAGESGSSVVDSPLSRRS